MYFDDFYTDRNWVKSIFIPQSLFLPKAKHHYTVLLLGIRQLSCAGVSRAYNCVNKCFWDCFVLFNHVENVTFLLYDKLTSVFTFDILLWWNSIYKPWHCYLSFVPDAPLHVSQMLDYNFLVHRRYARRYHFLSF